MMRKLLVSLLVVLPLVSCGEEMKHRVVILGVDGMDPLITRSLMDRGLLPNLKELAADGDFQTLGTSIPPESPVAWSDFVTGRNPGGHGVYDFLHPHWQQDGSGRWSLGIVDSLSGQEEVGMAVSMFGYEIPLTGGDSYNKRLGPAFWDVLEDGGVPATVFKIPANYPPTPTGQRTMSGMGTPDVRAVGYGKYYLFTDDPLAISDKAGDGGDVVTVSIYDNTIRTALRGPDSIKPGEYTEAPFRVDIDPTEPMIRILIDDDPTRQVILREGEWSDFVTVDYELIPYAVSVSGIARFHLQEARPTFRLFVDPVNIDPRAPVTDISTPSDWAAEIAERIGPYVTKGMPENTKALEEGVLTDDEFVDHSTLVWNERKRILFDLLDHYPSGLLYHYFSSIDLNSHMLWRCHDDAHPGHAADTTELARRRIEWLYQDLDDVVGRVREKLVDEDTLIVMSDHGFAPWYRKFNLNTWLLENGYLFLKPQEELDAAKVTRDTQLFEAVDWTRTKAYNLGFTGIYLNVKGRDPMGVVEPREAAALVDEIRHALMQESDPDPKRAGKSIFYTVYRASDVYSGEAVEHAPEIVTGFAREYRNSDESALGAVPVGVVADNEKAWSGCHLMAAEVVPGVVFANRKITKEDPKLYDLTVTILKEYGIEAVDGMVGRPLW